MLKVGRMSWKGAGDALSSWIGKLYRDGYEVGI